MGPYGTIWDHMGPYGTIWDHMGPKWSQKCLNTRETCTVYCQCCGLRLNDSAVDSLTTRQPFGVNLSSSKDEPKSADMNSRCGNGCEILKKRIPVYNLHSTNPRNMYMYVPTKLGRYRFFVIHDISYCDYFFVHSRMIVLRLITSGMSPSKRRRPQESRDVK